MTARRVIYPLLGALAIAATVILHAPAPAVACSGTRLMGSPDPPADIVFTGTAIRMEDPAMGPIISSGRMLEWTFAVDEVREGKIGSHVTVASAASSGSCGYEFQLGKRYLVRATYADGPPVVGMSSGTRPIESLSPRPKVEGAFRPPLALLSDVLYSPYIFFGIVLSLAAWVGIRRIAEIRPPDPH